MIRSTSLLARTTTGTQDITITGFGTVVGAVFYYDTYDTTDGVIIGKAAPSEGFTDGTNEGCISGLTLDAVTTTDTSRAVRDNAVISTSNATTDFVLANFVAFITDGVRINYSVTDATYGGKRLNVILIGGTMSASMNVVQMGAGAETVTVTTGFEPSFVLLANCGYPTLNTKATQMLYSSGFAVNDGLGTNIGSHAHTAIGQNPSSINSRVSGIYSSGQVLAPSTVSWEAAVGNYTATGFDIVPTATVTGDYIITLAVDADGASVKGVVTPTPTTTGTVTLGSTTFTPTFALVHTPSNTTLDAAYTQLSFGKFVADVDHQRGGSFSQYGGVSPSIVSSVTNNAKAMTVFNDALLLEASYVGFSSTGIDLNFTTANATPRQWFSLLVGDPAVPSPVSPEAGDDVAIGVNLSIQVGGIATTTNTSITSILWSAPSGTFDDATIDQPIWTAGASAGAVILTKSATDNLGETNEDTAVATVKAATTVSSTVVNPTDTTAQFVIKVGDVGTDYKVEYADNISFTSSSLSALLSTDGDLLLHADITGLTKNTTYYYRVSNAGATNADAFVFKTFAIEEPLSFTLGFGGCGAEIATTTTAYSRIKDKAANLIGFQSMGDTPYIDSDDATGATQKAGYLAYLSRADVRLVNDNMSYWYMWSDHDYGLNDDDETAAGKVANQANYRNLFPDNGVVLSSGAVYRAYTIGRVRFVMLDVRSERSTTGPVVISTTQMTWLKAEMDAFAANSNLRVFVFGNENIWVGDTYADSWVYSTAQRTEIVDYMNSSGILPNVVGIGSDEHSICMDSGATIDYGTGFTGGFPVVQSGPLNSNNLFNVGGPYDIGVAKSHGFQYCTMEIVDTPTNIDVIFTGYRADTDAIALDTNDGVTPMTYTHSIVIESIEVTDTTPTTNITSIDETVLITGEISINDTLVNINVTSIDAVVSIASAGNVDITDTIAAINITSIDESVTIGSFDLTPATYTIIFKTDGYTINS